MQPQSLSRRVQIPSRDLPHSRAFTVFELLGTLILLLILAALLFPVFMKPNEGGGPSCTANQHQVGTAARMYADDYDEHLPFARSAEGRYWPEILFSYVKTPRSYHCPGQKFTERDATPYKLNLHRVSYAYNVALSGAGEYIPHDKRKHKSHAAGVTVQDVGTLTQVLRPEATVLLTDAAAIPLPGIPPARWQEKAVWSESNLLLAEARSDPALQDIGTVAPLGRHSGHANVLWADGHVKSCTIESFYTTPGQTAPGEKVTGYSPCLDPGKGCPSK